MEICVKSFDGEKYTVEVGVDDTIVDLRQKVASAAGLRERGFDMSFGGKVMVEGDMTQLSAGDTVVLTKTTLQDDAIAALHALGEADVTAETLKFVKDPKVASLLLQAEVATAIPNYFLTGSSFITDIVFSSLPNVDDNCAIRTLHLPALPSVTTIGDYFLTSCHMLRTADLSGLHAVTAIGDRFLFMCTGLLTLDLSGLQAVTEIGDWFLYDCVSLSTADLSGLQAVTTIGVDFLGKCQALRTIRGVDKYSNVVRSRVLSFNNPSPPPEPTPSIGDERGRFFRGHATCDIS